MLLKCYYGLEEKKNIFSKIAGPPMGNAIMIHHRNSVYREWAAHKPEKKTELQRRVMLLTIYVAFVYIGNAYRFWENKKISIKMFFASLLREYEFACCVWLYGK